MTDSALIKSLIKTLAGTHTLALVKVIDCEVIDVDKDNFICNVKAIDGKHDLDSFPARYMLEASDGDCEIPEVGSTVSVSICDFCEPYIVKTTWINQKIIVVGNQVYNIVDGKQTFNDGGYGGIPIVEDSTGQIAGLVKIINKLENKVNNLISKYNAHTHLLTLTSGTGTAAPTVTTENPLTPLTSKTDMENPNITHGKSIK